MTTMYGLARLGKDAELRRTGQGDPVATLALAFSYGRKGEDGRKPTQWVDAALWGARAEALEQYLTKGTQIVVTLQDVHIETYEGKNGPGAKLVGRVLDLQLAGGGERQEQPAPRQSSAPRPPVSRAPGAAAGYGSAGSAGGFDDMDDDIAF